MNFTMQALEIEMQLRNEVKIEINEWETRI